MAILGGSQEDVRTIALVGRPFSRPVPSPAPPAPTFTSHGHARRVSEIRACQTTAEASFQTCVAKKFAGAEWSRALQLHPRLFPDTVANAPYVSHPVLDRRNLSAAILA